MRYLVSNPNKFLVPIVIKKTNGDLEQANLKPNDSVEITSEQMTDTIKNLTTAPRNILKIKAIKD